MNRKDFQFFFENTYEDVKKFIYYYCGDIAKTEDIIQDAYIKLWEKRDSLENKDKLRGLLFTIAKNQWLNEIKHNKVVLNFERKNIRMTSEPSPHAVLEEKEFGLKLEKALQDLNEKQRVVFLMHRLDKKKYKEIAQALQISVKSVEKRMGVALSFLHERLGRKL